MLYDVAKLLKFFDQSKQSKKVDFFKKKWHTHCVYTYPSSTHTLCTNVFHTFRDTHRTVCKWCAGINIALWELFTGGPCHVVYWNPGSPLEWWSGKEIYVYETNVLYIINVYVCVLTIAAVLQVWPDDVLLREAEHSQSSSSHCGINCHPRICTSSDPS